jgi:tetratricopeptide (TPR) repeat protein
MKLRENLYQVEMYRPRYLGIESKEPQTRRSLFERFEKIVLRAEQGVAEGIADIKALFGDTLDQLIDLMRGYGDNDLLVRFLLTQRKLFSSVYGRKRLDRLFASMFKNGSTQAHWVGAMSYLQSGYYDMAAALFAKAIDLAPNEEKLKFLYQYARGLDAYYSNHYEKALRLFGGLPDFSSSFKGKRVYLNHAIGICRDIAMESLAEQKRGTAQHANEMARQLKTSRQ